MFSPPTYFIAPLVILGVCIRVDNSTYQVLITQCSTLRSILQWKRSKLLILIQIDVMSTHRRLQLVNEFVCVCVLCFVCSDIFISNSILFQLIKTKVYLYWTPADPWDSVGIILWTMTIFDHVLSVCKMHWIPFLLSIWNLHKDKASQIPASSFPTVPRFCLRP
jgi:hypothetical protein